jgi:hypothetical protein
MTRKRRGRGEGGIRYREDKDLWVGEVRSADGKRRTVYGQTKAEVLEKMQQVRNEEAAGLTGEANTLILGQWGRAAGCDQANREPNTWAYNTVARLTPHSGAVKLAKLKAAHVRGATPLLRPASAAAAAEN